MPHWALERMSEEKALGDNGQESPFAMVTTTSLCKLCDRGAEFIFYLFWRWRPKNKVWAGLVSDSQILWSRWAPCVLTRSSLCVYRNSIHTGWGDDAPASSFGLNAILKTWFPKLDTCWGPVNKIFLLLFCFNNKKWLLYSNIVIEAERTRIRQQHRAWVLRGPCPVLSLWGGMVFLHVSGPFLAPPNISSLPFYPEF